MRAAFVLMTALPPTKGHLHLIQFAAALASETCVIVVSQPEEPYAFERVAALRQACPTVRFEHIHETLPQGPDEEPDYWMLWRNFLTGFGLQAGDAIVASEDYGFTLAAVTGAVFVPYDFDRGISPIKATPIRLDPLSNFAGILPEFQPLIRQRVTVLGAESTGKTTLSRSLAAAIGGHWLHEWVRPWLEHREVKTVDEHDMHLVWQAQKALQVHGRMLLDKPVIVQDTDLFATLGFWRNWSAWTVPGALAPEALADASDLYLITLSNIPFEADPLRYGVHERETSDEFWIDLAEEFGLNLRVLSSSTAADRVEEAAEIVRDHFASAVPLGYVRR